MNIKNGRLVQSMYDSKLILSWLKERGGLAVWGCLDLSDPGKTWTTPLRNADGTPKRKPHWAATEEPVMVVTKPEELAFSVDVEAARFHVAVRRGGGLNMELTDASSRKVRKAVEKAGDGAFHVFDYDTQEAVIMAPVGGLVDAESIKEV